MSLTGSPALSGLGGLGASLDGLGATIPASVGTPSFWDKLSSNTSDFFTNPANILKTVATLGALSEVGGDDTTTTTQNMQKTLPPELQDILFGANGVFPQIKTWMAQNPTGQNQTMRDAQTGMRNFATDPNVLGSIFRQGFAGNSLLQTPVAPNPWLVKTGG